MKIEVNPWKILVYLIWILGVGFFMIPTKQAIEQFILNQFGFQHDYLWLPLYIGLWRLWEGIEWIRKQEQGMSHKE